MSKNIDYNQILCDFFEAKNNIKYNIHFCMHYTELFKIKQGYTIYKFSTSAFQKHGIFVENKVSNL
jgi:hypothetical protein